MQYSLTFDKHFYLCHLSSKCELFDSVFYSVQEQRIKVLSKDDTDNYLSA